MGEHRFGGLGVPEMEGVAMVDVAPVVVYCL